MAIIFEQTKNTQAKLVQLFYFILIFYMAECFHKGAPPFACKTLIPGHDGVMNTPSPYGIFLSSNDVAPGGSIHVSLRTVIKDPDVKFKGFLCNVSPIDENSNSALGRFEYMDPSLENKQQIARLLDCSRSPRESGITHRRPANKTEVKFKWYAPQDANVGDRYKLRCTFVQNFSLVWADIRQVLDVVDPSDIVNNVNVEPVNPAVPQIFDNGSTSNDGTPNQRNKKQNVGGRNSVSENININESTRLSNSTSNTSLNNLTQSQNNRNGAPNELINNLNELISVFDSLQNARVNPDLTLMLNNARNILSGTSSQGTRDSITQQQFSSTTPTSTTALPTTPRVEQVSSNEQASQQPTLLGNNLSLFLPSSNGNIRFSDNRNRQLFQDANRNLLTPPIMRDLNTNAGFQSQSRNQLLDRPTIIPFRNFRDNNNGLQRRMFQNRMQESTLDSFRNNGNTRQRNEFMPPRSTVGVNLNRNGGGDINNLFSTSENNFRGRLFQNNRDFGFNENQINRNDFRFLGNNVGINSQQQLTDRFSNTNLDQSSFQQTNEQTSTSITGSRFTLDQALPTEGQILEMVLRNSLEQQNSQFNGDTEVRNNQNPLGISQQLASRQTIFQEPTDFRFDNRRLF